MLLAAHAIEGMHATTLYGNTKPQHATKRLIHQMLFVMLFLSKANFETFFVLFYFQNMNFVFF